jgi:hypothetical protein
MQPHYGEAELKPEKGSWTIVPFTRGRIRTPYWFNILVVSFVPVLLLESIDNLVIQSPLAYALLGSGLFFGLFAIYFFYGAHHISQRVEKLRQYVTTLPSGTNLHLTIRHNWYTVLIVWLGLIGTFVVLFGIPENPTVFMSEHDSVIVYFLLVFAYFLSTYATAMLAIYRGGKMPFQVRPFTEDKVLGLRPFSTTSLRLVSVYAILPALLLFLMTFNIIIDNKNGVVVSLNPLNPSNIIFIVGLVLIGLGLFFLPLYSIHRRLKTAKQQELAWIGPEYTRLVQIMKNNATKQDIAQSNSLTTNLIAVRQLQNDAQHIPAWPFDLGICIRLATLLLLPPILSVIARILVLVFLHL